MIKHVLAVETSCDDTSVAIVKHDGQVIKLLSATQDLDHEPYGGIVPEIASRNHSFYLLGLIDQSLKQSNMTWRDIDAFAVTNRPGLMGSLIVGLVTIKTLAQSLNKPFIGVNHLEGHLLAPFLYDESSAVSRNHLNFPFISLAVSGGHTTLYLVKDWHQYQVLGSTRDDAVGEAFDKFAKMVGLGFPGGARVDREARSGDPERYSFPRSMIQDESLEMSFSGLKSAAHRLLSAMSVEEIKKQLPDLCASFQEAIVDVLVKKMLKACQQYNIHQAIVTGGVSANSRLRQRAIDDGLKNQIQVTLVPLKYCTDNAAMIGFAGIQRLNKGQKSDLLLGASTRSLSEDFL